MFQLSTCLNLALRLLRSTQKHKHLLAEMRSMFLAQCHLLILGYGVTRHELLLQWW